jgi:SHS2 domain-containing protein
VDPQAYFEHDADVGVIGRGRRIEDAFTSAAQAMFALMTDISKVKPADHFAFDFDEPDMEFALVTWLNGLLARARERGLVLGEFRLERRNGHHWHGEAWGEPWREGLEPGTEPKGATLTMLSVMPSAGGWEARCVVDV